MSRRTLEGILVVALEQAVAAPFCTSRLADAGARVIKIERPKGISRAATTMWRMARGYFVWLNRGKQSVVLDFKKPEDAALLHRLIGKADVLIQNLAPGAAQRAGFGAEMRCSPQSAADRLRHLGLWRSAGPTRNDGLRSADPVRDRPGLDHRRPESPGRVGVSVADIGCGMNAHAAILEALTIASARARAARSRHRCSRAGRLDGRAADPPRIHRS